MNIAIIGTTIPSATRREKIFHLGRPRFISGLVQPMCDPSLEIVGSMSVQI